MNITPIQFQKDDRDPVRLEKLRRLAEQLALVARSLGTSGPTYSVFTSSVNGLVPAPGASTGFLRHDGTWADPAGGDCDCEQITADIAALQSSMSAVQVALTALALRVTTLEADAVMAGDPVSVLTNDAGYITSSALPVGANPSASVGLATVNGTALTFMRSDGAPALSQAIAPTWTGTHTFTVNTTVWDYADNTYALSVRGATGRFLVRPYINATFGVGFEATNTAQTLNIALSLIADPLKIYNGGTEVGRFDGSVTARDTRLMVYDVDSGALQRVTVGAADSGGTGFKLLRIPN